MGAVCVLLLLLVCVFTAAEGSLNVTCVDVTGHVGDNLTPTCRVSYDSDRICVKMYKFVNKDKDSEIYREIFTEDSCIQLSSFSCSYTANEVMTTTFKFFIQTSISASTAEFTVNIPGTHQGENQSAETDPKGETQKDNAVLVVTGLVICLVIVVAVGLILKKYNCFNILQRRYNQGEREENNIDENPVV